jgi:hypothetical protein
MSQLHYRGAEMKQMMLFGTMVKLRGGQRYVTMALISLKVMIIWKCHAAGPGQGYSLTPYSFKIIANIMIAKLKLLAFSLLHDFVMQHQYQSVGCILT